MNVKEAWNLVTEQEAKELNELDKLLHKTDQERLRSFLQVGKGSEVDEWPVVAVMRQGIARVMDCWSALDRDGVRRTGFDLSWSRRMRPMLFGAVRDKLARLKGEDSIRLSGADIVDGCRYDLNRYYIVDMEGQVVRLTERGTTIWQQADREQPRHEDENEKKPRGNHRR